MKILPIGDAVVLGDGASGGFRHPLETLLKNAEIDFEYVGSRMDNSYEMTYPLHEGIRGAKLSDLREDVLPMALALRPDVILLYAATEDVKELPNPGIAIARYEKLIKAVLDSQPNVSLICSQLIPAKDYNLEQKIKSFNRSLGALIEHLQSKNLPVSRVKMHAKVKVETLNEVGMPNEQGYSAMAPVWFHAIQEISRRSNETVVPER